MSAHIGNLLVLLVCVLGLAAPAVAEEMDCEAPVEVYDGSGNLILTFTQVYIGNTPFEEFTAWAWHSDYATNFYKQTIVNHTDQPIRYIQVFKECFDVDREYCMDDDGDSYICDQSSEYVLEFDDENLALWNLQSNTLPPGAVVVQQDATGFDVEEDFTDSHGEVDYETWTIEYSGSRYEFTTCKSYP